MVERDDSCRLVADPVRVRRRARDDRALHGSTGISLAQDHSGVPAPVVDEESEPDEALIIDGET